MWLYSAEPHTPPTPLYALYAAHPPPPGPLEAADATDEEASLSLSHFFHMSHPIFPIYHPFFFDFQNQDLYDWFTWRRAIVHLSADAFALDALRAAACVLAAAARVGGVPDTHGGVFGNEWIRGARVGMSRKPIFHMAHTLCLYTTGFCFSI